MPVSAASMDFQQQRIRLSLLARNLSLPSAIHSSSQITNPSYLPADITAAAGGTQPHQTSTIRRRDEEICFGACRRNSLPDDIRFGSDPQPGPERKTTPQGKQDSEQLHRRA